MAPSTVGECSAKEQTVAHVDLHCPIHRPPHGVHQGRTQGGDEGARAPPLTEIA